MTLLCPCVSVYIVLPTQCTVQIILSLSTGSLIMTSSSSNSRTAQRHMVLSQLEIWKGFQKTSANVFNQSNTPSRSNHLNKIDLQIF